VIVQSSRSSNARPPRALAGPSTKMLISPVVEFLQKIRKHYWAREFRCGC
jgi:hypothetical protein